MLILSEKAKSNERTSRAKTEQQPRKRKRKQNRSSKVHESIWVNCFKEEVSELPYDIDGTCVFKLKFQLDFRMKSTVDGRPWKTWVTSSRKEFDGLRRKARCGGSFFCANKDCAFLKFYGKQNKLQFDVKEKSCNVCGLKGVYIECEASKIWEFEDDTETVTVYHTGFHTCAARKPFVQTEEVNQRLSQNGVTVTRSTEDAIIDGIKADETSWEEVHRIADSTLDREKLYYTKKKEQILTATV